jgi:hypothetical protein
VLERADAEGARVLGGARVDHLLEPDRGDPADVGLALAAERGREREHRARIARLRQRERGGEADLVVAGPVELLDAHVHRVGGGHASTQHQASGGDRECPHRTRA